MRSPRLCALLAVLGVPIAVTAQTPVAMHGVKVTHATATLQPVASPSGRPALLLLLRVEDGWHVSYRNPGETGLSTRLAWSLPAGVRVSREVWPVPRVTQTDVGVTHTLEGEVPWLIEFDAPRTRDDALVSLTLRYGVCREVCIPAQLTVQGALPSAAQATLGRPTAAVQARLVREGGALGARRQADGSVCVQQVPLADAAGLPAVLADTTLMLPVSLGTGPGRPKIHGLFMNSSEPAVLRHGRRFLFVRNGAAVTATLDFRRAAPECRAR